MAQLPDAEAYFVHLNNVFTVCALLYCGFVSIVCMMLYMAEKQYQPVFFTADILYFFAVSGSFQLLISNNHKLVVHMIGGIISAITIVLCAYNVALWGKSVDVYQGTTYPFYGIQQNTTAPNVYYATYNARFAAVIIAIVVSVINIVTFLAVRPHDEQKLSCSCYFLFYLPIVVLIIARLIVSGLNVPRLELSDSSMFVVLSGLILCMDPSLARMIWLGIGLIFGTMYISVLSGDECFLDIACYQLHFATSTYVRRSGAVLSAHVFAETTYASHILSVLLIAFGWMVYLLSLLYLFVDGLRFRYNSLKTSGDT